LAKEDLQVRLTMSCLIEKVMILDERKIPGGAAWNMAADEALLGQERGAVLRVYRWRSPALSFGYFLPWESACVVSGGRELVRRWTGGGMVAHGEDFTWSLILPSAEPLGRQRPVESYTTIHGALAEAMRGAGIKVEQAGATAAPPPGGFCFTAPAPGDLLQSGRKIAGAGQRRCRQGLLHQGSVSGVDLPENFPERLAEALASTVERFPADRMPVEAAERLEIERYGSESWLRKR
jgi:lipoyl(octanoyl) transferase